MSVWLTKSLRLFREIRPCLISHLYVMFTVHYHLHLTLDTKLIIIECPSYCKLVMYITIYFYLSDGDLIGPNESLLPSLIFPQSHYPSLIEVDLN